MNNDLIKKAKKAQARVDEVSAPYMQNRKNKFNAERERVTTFNAKLEETLALLARFDNLPISVYVWRTGGGGYSVSEENYLSTKISHHYRDNARTDNSHSTRIDFYQGYTKSIKAELVEVDGVFTYKLERSVYSKDEVARYLDLKPGNVWNKSSEVPVKRTFTKLSDLIKTVEDFVTKTLDLKRYEIEVNKADRAAILSEYLKLDASTFKVDQNINPHGVLFKVSDDKSYRVLKPNEVKDWFAVLVMSRMGEFFDAELLSNCTDLNAHELHALKITLDAKSFNRVLKSLVKGTSYGTEYAKRYSFDKYVLAYKNYFVVNTGAI